MKNKQKITDTSCPSCWEKWNEQNKNNIDEVEIEIQQILEPYFVVLDGGDNEPANDIIIEISEKIKQKLQELEKTYKSARRTYSVGKSKRSVGLLSTNFI